jgi:segregation and condensation protein A
VNDVQAVPPGFHVEQAGYQGDLAGLARALRNGSLAPRELDLLGLVEEGLRWFDAEADRDLDVASAALPQLAQVIELKLRLLLPRPPRQDDLFDDEEDETERALEAVALLEELTSAIDFLRTRRFERAVIVPARTERPDLPRVRRPLATTVDRLAALAAAVRPGAYFEMAFERLTIEDAGRRLRAALGRVTRGGLRSVVPTRSWAERTVVFAALLELIREGRVRAAQRDAFGEIEIARPRRRRG